MSVKKKFVVLLPATSDVVTGWLVDGATAEEGVFCGLFEKLSKSNDAICIYVTHVGRMLKTSLVNKASIVSSNYRF